MSMQSEKRYFLLPVAVAVALAIGASGLQAAELPVKDGQNIAFLGDSITQQGAGTGGYVRLVISGLEANGIKATAIPAGISGHKSNQMLERLDRDVLSKKPDWMTLSCGVNDVWHGAKGVPLDQYKQNITKIVDRCQAAGVKVMILTSTMIGEDQANANNQKLSAYNDFLRSLAKEKNCLLADLNAEMQAALVKAARTEKTKGNLLTRDGVHMNPAGNQMMAIGVLKGFGLTSEQIAQAQKAWGAKSESSSAKLAASSAQSVETKEHRDARMKWWREAKFGMFIHWGVYSVPAGTYDGKQIGGIGEWIMNRGKIPVAELRRVRQAVQPREVRRRRVGEDRQGRRHEVHRDHLEAPRRLRHVPLQGQPLQHLRRHALQARPAGRTGRGLPEGRASSWASTIRRPRTGTIPAARPSAATGTRPRTASMDEYIDKIAVPQVQRDPSATTATSPPCSGGTRPRT